jgi:D-glycero-D-manno-heptose 1,7-bisphosphate phosphatase
VSGPQHRPAVFLDRDGVVNHDDHYVHEIEKFRWMEGAQAAIKALNDADYLVIVVTNQAGIARGFFAEEDVEQLHHWMNQELEKWGAHIDAFYFCPHHPEGVVARYAVHCESRKPAPGMLLRAMREWPVRREGSVMIGDKDSDLAAGRAAGLPVLLFSGGDLERFVRSQILGELFAGQ